MQPMKDMGVFGWNIRNPQGDQSAFHHSAEIYLLEDFQKKDSPNFNKFHSCGYDDHINADGEECANSVADFSTFADPSDIWKTIEFDKQARADHSNYWGQYSHLCDKDSAAELNLFI